jgi:quercetin dioxygenase-like cupin family protein
MIDADTDPMGERGSPRNARRLRMTLVVAGLIALAGGPGAVHPQATGFAVTPLLRTPLSADASREVLVATGRFEPAGTTGRHTHHGDEYATVIEGTVEVVTAGQPPRRYTAGEAYHNARDVVHETRNVGATQARVVSTLIVDTGRPLIEPAN